MEMLMPQKLHEFSNQLEQSLGRLRALRAENGTESISAEFVDMLFQELLVYHEDLRVADEELLQQSEALASAYQAIEAERYHYLELFELTPDAYVVTSASGVIVEANRAAHLLF